MGVSVKNPKQELQTGENKSTGNNKRKRGRPRKVQPIAEIDPDVLHRAIFEVKKMAREYARGDLQYDVRYIEAVRPRLLKSAGISSDDTGDGHIRYDAQSVKNMTEKDRKVIRRYINSRKAVAFLEKTIAEIPEDKIHEVAQATLLKGTRVVDFAEQCGFSERTVRWRKHRALEYLADQYLATLMICL